MKELKFSKRIYETRKDLGLTQQELSDKLGINQSAIAKWEAGELEPSLSMLLKISEICNVSIDYLLGAVDY